jgi:hypothetical protein
MTKEAKKKVNTAAAVLTLMLMLGVVYWMALDEAIREVGAH